MTTESIVCQDFANCGREHAGGLGGTPVHPPENSVIRPGHFDSPLCPAETCSHVVSS